ncbi:MAG: hypothetical protein JO020_20955 [Chloroflexi bacterium]|nr:hypothetical protein [Chloroflexota bacterium]MBV9896643.1 hypothetical protein [Chloroflexota bacterium]
MSTFLMQEALSWQSWTTILDGQMDPHPLSDPKVLAAGFEQIGGTLSGLWLSAANAELVYIVELPDVVDAVACSLRYVQRGQYGPIRITPLLTPQEAVRAIERAVTLPKGYKVTGSDR